MSKPISMRDIFLSGLLCSLFLCGCSTPQRFYAASLPSELLAPTLTNAQSISLARFSIATPETDTIRSGDVLEVTISAGLGKDDTIDFPIRINERGEAGFPSLGKIPLAGFGLEEAEAAIRAAFIQEGLYRSPHVTVIMKSPKINRVMVVGAVEKPGVYELRAGSSNLLAALTSAGGLAEDAGTLVEIKNPGRPQTVPPLPRIASAPGSPHHLTGHTVPARIEGPKSVNIDLASSSDISKSGFRIQDGGVVTVEKRVAKPIHVLGLVRRPGRHEFPVAEDLRLLDAIALAQGISNPVADKIFIIRAQPGKKKPVLIQASLAKAKINPDENLRLSPGDIVSLEKTPSTILMDTVRMIGFTLGGSVF